MRGIKILFGTTALLAGLALAPAVKSQVYVSVGVQPVCEYGYYDYAPYACSPMDITDRVLLQRHLPGMGPWAGGLQPRLGRPSVQ